MKIAVAEKVDGIMIEYDGIPEYQNHGFHGRLLPVQADHKNQIIPVHIIDIKEEIRILKNQIAALVQEKTELEQYICPRLKRAYFDAFGEYGMKIQALEIKIRELKYRIRLLQSALNRKQAVACSYVDAQVKQAYQDCYDKVEKEKQRQQEEWKKQQGQEEQRKHYEQEYNRNQADQGQTGSHQYADNQNRQFGNGKNVDNSNRQSKDGRTENGHNQQNVNDQDPKNKDGKNRQNQENEDGAVGDKAYQDEFVGMSYKEKLKALYRAIMKKLHPDANPNITEYQKELLRKAMEAYSRGDIKTLEEIYDEIINSLDLQEHAHPFGPVDKFYAAVRQLDQWIKEAGSTTVIYMTWAKKDEEFNQQQMTDAHKQITEETGALLAPVGEYWWTYMRSWPDLEMYYKDGQHASPHGSRFAEQMQR